METINKTWKPVTIGGFTGVMLGLFTQCSKEKIGSARSAGSGQAGSPQVDSTGSPQDGYVDIDWFEYK